MTLLDLTRIRLDGGTQPRAETDSTAIEDYSHAMLRGDQFPPLVVFHDGQDHWLASGYHRYHAAIAAGFEELDCDVRQGTRREAVLFSAGVNAEHGLRRTRDDLRRAVRKLLDDEEWRRRADNWIADQARVSLPFVTALRAELYPDLSSNGLKMRTVQRGDSVYDMKTANIGRRPAPALYDAEEGRPIPVSAPHRPSGHRETDERSRTIAVGEALRAIVTAQRTLPDPRVVVASNPDVSLDEAFRISAWWARYAALMRGRAERAS